MLQRLALLLSTGVFLAACGTGSQADDAVPITGELLFNQTNQIIPSAPSCRSCHVIEAGVAPVVGPNLHGIATIAGTRVSDQTADAYLRISIVAPNDYLVEGYQSGIMPRTYGDLLTADQIEALVNYMLTLE